MKIVTRHDPPPVPFRGWDWLAWDEETYDYTGPLGIGPTKQAAIDDLLEQIEAREEK